MQQQREESLPLPKIKQQSFTPDLPLASFYVISQNKVKCQQISPVQAHLYIDLRWPYNIKQLDLEK
jgi:hypothetical protein